MQSRPRRSFVPVGWSREASEMGPSTVFRVQLPRLLEKGREPQLPFQLIPGDAAGAAGALRGPQAE